MQVLKFLLSRVKFLGNPLSIGTTNKKREYIVRHIRFLEICFRLVIIKCLNVKKILAVINATYAVAKKSLKKSGLPGFEP